MRIEGTREFAAPREAVFAALVDPGLAAEAMPGVREVAVRDAEHWSAEVRAPLPASPRLRFAFELLERDEPERARLRARGRTLGGALTIDTEFRLAQAGERTAMTFLAEIGLSGLLGRLGEPVVRPAAARIVGSMLDAVERRLAGAAR